MTFNRATFELSALYGDAQNKSVDSNLRVVECQRVDAQASAAATTIAHVLVASAGHLLQLTTGLRSVECVSLHTRLSRGLRPGGCVGGGRFT